MPTFKVAHIREQGVDLIIVPLQSSFGNLTSEEQQREILALQMAARGAGLAGTVVPVWDSFGRMAFIAPSQWHAFFKSINLQWVARCINRQLSW